MTLRAKILICLSLNQTYRSIPIVTLLFRIEFIRNSKKLHSYVSASNEFLADYELFKILRSKHESESTRTLFVVKANMNDTNSTHTLLAGESLSI